MISILMKVFVTGTAGFIGFHLAKHLLERGDQVIGFDNVNDYYDVSLKESRLEILEGYDDYIFHKASLENMDDLDSAVKEHNPDKFCNLAAQAGVRYSLDHPLAYVDSNLVGFINVLETCRRNDIGDLVYASSSSVYGGNTKIPFSVKDSVDSPISLYAATKRSNELMAHVYSHLFGLNTTGLRFFTVYGPYGRPDMAMFKFTRAILEGRPIDVFNNGDMERDFTYIDDIISGVTACIDQTFRYEILNLGNNRPQNLEYFISLIEKELGIVAKKNYLPMQPGDVKRTYADIERSRELIGYVPKTKLEEGVPLFIEWYRHYYGL
jgi:UDP-glucuronate 4-epimerase